jgi:hypothetical protein
MIARKPSDGVELRGNGIGRFDKNALELSAMGANRFANGLQARDEARHEDASVPA